MVETIKIVDKIEEHIGRIDTIPMYDYHVLSDLITKLRQRLYQIEVTNDETNNTNLD